MSKNQGFWAACAALLAMPAHADVQTAHGPISPCRAVVQQNLQGSEVFSVGPSIIQLAIKATLSIEIPSYHDGDQDQSGDENQQLGSGVLISPDGLLLTNAHVVGAGTRFSVRLFDGTIRQASLVGLDRLVDIALLRLDGDRTQIEPLTYLRLKLSHNPQIGEPVIALGYPLNFGLSATRGIVSGLGRAYDGVWPVDFLQHDAALNPGNSGGPLIDAQGCLIGLNTATPVETQFDIGVGLAIPAELIGEIVPQLLSVGTFPRGHLGLYVSAAEPSMTHALGAPARGGLMIDDIDTSSAGAQAGFAQGDLITHLDDRPVRQVRDLTQYLLRRRMGEAVQITIIRAGRVRVVRVTLGAAPLNTPQKLVIEARNVPSTPPLDAGLGFDIAPDTTQARVASVVSESVADAAGLQVGDEILALNGTAVTNAAHAQALIAAMSRVVGAQVIVARIGRADMRGRHVKLTLPQPQVQRRGHRSSNLPRQNLPYGPV